MIGSADNAGSFSGPEDQVATGHADLGPLQRNGGIGSGTFTHALLPTSTAIDRGDPTTCPDTDQRYYDRPKHGGISLRGDIGAFEYEGATLVELVYFRADASEDNVILTWETASENSTAGFHLWRSDLKDGEYIPITNHLIPSAGEATYGASYSYNDDGVLPGNKYFYKLQEIRTDGTGAFYGPAPVRLE